MFLRTQAYVPRQVVLLGSIAFLLGVWAPRVVAASRARVDESIVRSAEAYMNAMRAGDAVAAAAMFDDAAILLPACQPLVEGRAAIEAYYRAQFSGPQKITAFTTEHLASVPLGDAGYDVGTYRMTMSVGPGQSIEDTGKVVAILKRNGSGWKVSYLIYNSDRLPQAPQSPSSR
jgi:ketosteroid isomerase-like protein